MPSPAPEWLAAAVRELAKMARDGGAPMSGTLRAMACHETHVGSERMCVGWVHQQLGPGNNIALRFRALTDRSIADYVLVGEQHETLEDTIR